MNLDLNEIEKLNPPGLLNLRPMEFVVEVITNLIAAQITGSPVMLKLVRALGRYQKQVRENAAFNLNVKIKAWVLAKAERRAWVRGIIGEAAIRRWQIRYDNLADPLPSQPVRRPAPRSAPLQDCLPYTWKRFAMANLNWLRTIPMDRTAVASTSTSTSTSASGIASGLWKQPRGSRGFKPVEFWAFELAADYQPEDDRGCEPEYKPDETAARKQGATVPDPPPPQKQDQSSTQTSSAKFEHKPP